MMRSIIAVAMGLLIGGSVLAHEVAKGPNGGRIADAGPYHVELVTKAQTVEVHLTDADDKPTPAAAFKGVALLIVDGKSQRIPLAPAGQSYLAGTASGPLPRTPKGAVQLTMPDGKTVSARFN
jgi:hypothetical protein